MFDHTHMKLFDYVQKMCSETFQKQNIVKDSKNDIKLYNFILPLLCLYSVISALVANRTKFGLTYD